MKTNDLSCKIAGAAGDGILSAGMLFAKTCMRGGLDVFATAEYPSLIRGGHNHLDVRIVDNVSSHSKNIDVLVAFNQDAIEYHYNKISAGGALIYDDAIQISEKRKDIHHIAVPLTKIALENGGLIMRNTVALGAIFGLTDFDLGLFNDIMAEKFGKKDASVVESNIKAAKAGYDFAKQKTEKFEYVLKKKPSPGNIFLTGNEAISIGAIKAGCKFFSAYPMTPASSLLGYMAANEKQFGIIVKHTEDEIAAINMAIGAGYAGVRAMTSTSGGGFALMVEALGMAAMTETPVVIVEAQRPGPATGMATHSGQADLKFVINAAPDEFPRIIVAPGDVDECYHETIRAFNLSEKYQMPAIILTDKFLGESYWSTKEFGKTIPIERGLIVRDIKDGEKYKRYKITETGVSPRALPGTKNGMHVVSTYEHDEKGFEREEEAIRVAMHNKRFSKIPFILKELPEPKIIGKKDADITIIGWGSTKGAIKEAIKLLEKKGINANFLQVLYVSPFPSDKIKQILSSAKLIVDIENNKTSQLAGVLKESTGIDADYKIVKYDGRPFTPEDIEKVIIDIHANKAEKIIIINGYTEATKDLDKIKMRAFKVMQ